MKRRPILLGTSDFPKLRRAGALFVDKSLLISELLRDPAEVLLLPRPRRFGKTLNLSMVEAFLARSGAEARELFEGLAVEEEGEEVWGHFGRYPVLSITFKDVKFSNWADAFDSIRDLVAAMARQHAYLQTSERLDAKDRASFRALREGTADTAGLTAALRNLSNWAHEVTGEQAVILVDEYDTPIHAAVEYGYYDDALTFFRNFLSGGLKDNEHLFKGVLTGILRVAKESLFSGVNNLSVYSLLHHKFSQSFGFTPSEVEALAREVGIEDQLDALERWYDGYRFGGQVVYNPWSVISFAADPAAGPRPYWVNTASDALLRRLLADQGALPAALLERLLAGESVEQVVAESLSLRDVDSDPEAVWTLLLHSGYLRAAEVLGPEGLDWRVRLSIPNREVAECYRSLFRSWLRTSLGPGSPQQVVQALLAGDAEALAAHLEPLLVRSSAHLDFGGRLSERVYQAFIVGLLVHTHATHSVQSHPESGFGRADVLVIPRRAGEPGAVVELKVLGRNQTVEQALDAALRQIRDRDYAQRLRDAGADPVHLLAVVFDGKRAHAATPT